MTKKEHPAGVFFFVREEIKVKSEKLWYAAAGGMILIVPHSGTPQFFTLLSSLFTQKRTPKRPLLLLFRLS